MKKLTSLERILTTIELKEPDVVPTFELAIDRKVIDVILPGASLEDLVEHLDLDAIMLQDMATSWSYETINSSKRIMQDQWGGIVQFTSEIVGHPIGGAIESEKDLDNYAAPDPDLDWRYDKLKQAVKRFKGEKAIIAHVMDVFHVVKESLFGEVAYYKTIKRKPNIIEQANEIVTNYHLRYLKNCLDLGADIVLVSGDWAMSKGPMMSPEFTKKFLAPPLQKIAELAHSRGVPCLKHTDGNIWPIYDIIIDTGVDGIHPIDPLAGMDIGEAKAVFGDKVCLMGNVNCATNLCTGTIEDVREETKEVIRKAGKGGGLICMSSNSIHSGVKPENYVAMVKAIREYGNYPLNFV